MNYNDVNAANYSILAKLSIHPLLAREALQQPERNTAFFTIGNYVDEGVWGNPAETHLVVEDKFIPDPSTKLSDVLQLICKSETLFTTGLTNELILACVKKIGYQPNYKDETVISKIREMEPYLEAYKQSVELKKSLISRSQRILSEQIIADILENPFYNSLVSGQQYFQPELFWQLNDIDCKGKLDIVVVNHVSKTIRVVDIKTYEDDAFKNFYRYRYYYQGPFYTFGVSNNLHMFGADSSYAILPPVYVFAHKKREKPVRFIELTNYSKFLEDSSELRTLSGNSLGAGIPVLLRDLEWHKENNLWEYPKAVYANNGIESITF